VRIALLDTGVDLTHPEFEDYLRNGQLHAGIDLYDQGNKHGVVDLDGHGTHMCHTLLRTAPFTRVYPTRLHNCAQRKVHITNIYRAIRYAVKVWDVDIITMCFAFTNDQAEIEDAMDAVQKQKEVLILAAASNNTALESEPVGFPARASEHVICVNSSSAADMKSNFSPEGIDGQANLSAVGEGIKASWPLLLQSHNSNQPYKILDGTSSATIIAAGIAALILDFSRYNGLTLRDDELKSWNKMKTKLQKTDDMRMVIWKCMTHKKGGCGYNFIKP
ncbi:subtilisin-like protein, partial [Cryphonectria parasitica EP155]